MASHVFVIDGRARKIRVQTTPQTYLSDIKEQGCAKLGVDGNQYGLKYNNKNIDLSLTIRLSGLPGGAQLSLVQASRSPTVVNVALQIGEQRYSQKFPSNASLWQVLRVFEEEKKQNFTERHATPTTSSGAGRLFYEQPLLTYMNREFGALIDLQKTLAQIGLAGGSALLRLTFKATNMPLEEAMMNISQFFKQEPTESIPEAFNENIPITEEPSTKEDVVMSDDGSEELKTIAAPLSPSAELMTPQPPLLPTDATPSIITGASATPPISVAPSIFSKPSQLEDKAKVTLPTSNSQNSAPTTQSESSAQPPAQSPSSVTIFKPSSSNAPLASQIPFSENDFVPTIDHATSHQTRLQTASRNTRLPSDAELAAQAAAKDAAIKAVASVAIRVRLPDQALVQATLPRPSATAAHVYRLVRERLRSQEAKASGAFVLRWVDGGRKHVDLKDDDGVDLIQQLGWKGNVLVYMVWSDAVSESVKGAPALRDEDLRGAKSVDVIVKDATVAVDDGGKSVGSGIMNGIGKAFGKGKEKASGAEKEAKLKNLLGFGRKK